MLPQRGFLRLDSSPGWAIIPYGREFQRFGGYGWVARARLRDGPALSHVRGVTTLDMGAIDPASINRNAFSYFNRLKRVERFVQAHYAEDISRKAVAEVAALEEKYFSTFFREKTGVRFRDWLTLVRVSRAMALLRSRNHPISIVASQAGFHSLRTFERSFKRCTGVTPRRYRKHAIAL